MRWRAPSSTAGPIAFESYGVRVLVEVEAAGLRRQVEQILPESRRACDPGDPDLRYLLRSDGRAGLDVISGEVATCLSAEADVAIAVLETQIRTAIALRAREGIFVHAGVVSHAGRAALMPGASFSGKTTLVESLVREGADYLSDEYAVLDADGLVHPYPKPLSLRPPGQHRQSESRVESLGGRQGEVALPVGLIVITSFRPDAVWRPEGRSAGQGALALLANTIAARVRPAECMRAVSRASESALVLEGERGEAAEVAPRVLSALEHAPDPVPTAA